MEDIATIIISICLIVLAITRKLDKKYKYVACCMFILQIFVCSGSMMSGAKKNEFVFDYLHILGFLGYNLLNIIGIGFLIPPKKNEKKNKKRI